MSNEFSYVRLQTFVGIFEHDHSYLIFRWMFAERYFQRKVQFFTFDSYPLCPVVDMKQVIYVSFHTPRGEVAAAVSWEVRCSRLPTLGRDRMITHCLGVSQPLVFAPECKL